MTLEGTRVLLVEDDSLVAMSVEDMLTELGCIVGATAVNLSDAIEHATTGEFDFALLDVNLRGKEVYPVAQILTDRSIPFAFASGYGRPGLPEHYRNQPIVSKPFQLEELSAVLSAALTE